MQRQLFYIKGAKGGGGDAHTPVEQPDSIRSQAKARLLIALGEGEMALGLDDTKIFLDGTPLGNPDGSRNFDGVRWEVRPGVQQQDPISGFPAVENETGFGTEIKQASPWVHALTRTEIDAVVVRVGVPALMYQEDDGDVVGTSVSFRIDLAVGGGTFSTQGKFAISGKTTTLYERSIRVNLPRSSSGWRIRVVRETPDSDSARLANTLKIQAITEVIDARFRYPHTALLFIEFNAKSFQNIPKISCLAKGRIIRVPSNYDPDTRTYSGNWDGSFKWAYTNNPAWVWYDVLTQPRFGLGKRVTAAMLDKWELYRIAQRCDQMVPDGAGGVEPRFEFNCYLQAQADAWTVIRDIAAGFNGLTYWGNNMFNVVSDMPVKAPSQIVTRASIIGKPTYSSGSRKTRFSSALVNYSDAQNHYADTPTAVMFQELVAQLGFEQTQLTAIGCTRESEAQRRASWAVLTNSVDRLVKLRVGLEGFAFLPGTVFALADERIGGRVMGGRVAGYDEKTKQVMLDRTTDGKPGDDLLIRTTGGAVESRKIASVGDSVVTIAEPFTAAPAVNAVWVVDSGELALQKFRVLTLDFDDENNTFEISAAEYNDSKYDAVDDGARLDKPPVSLLPTGIVNAPTAVAITSYEQVRQNQRVTTMRATWEPSRMADGKVQPDIVAYEAQWRRGANDWVNVPASSVNGFEVQGVFAGDYLVRVRAVTSSGASSVWASSVLTHIDGRQGEVPAPVSLRASSDVVFGIDVAWAFPKDAEDTEYTEIQYAPTNTEEAFTALSLSPYPSKSFAHSGLKANAVFWYRARLVDRLGNKSEWGASVQGRASIDTDSIMDALGDQVMSSEGGKALETSINAAIDAIEQNAIANDGDIQRKSKKLGELSAEIVRIDNVVVNEVGALAESLTAVKASVAENEAAVATKMTAKFDYDGNGYAVWDTNAGITYNGEYYSAGMSISAEVKEGEVSTQVAMLADRFAVMAKVGDKPELMFGVVGDQAYLRDAFIRDASIGSAKIAGVLQSDDYTPGGAGWTINKSGAVEFNNATIRGTVYAENGDFKGTVHANRIVGDVVQYSNFTFSSKDVSVGNGATRVLFKVPAEDFEQTIISNGYVKFFAGNGGMTRISCYVESSGVRKVLTELWSNGVTAEYKFNLSGLTLPPGANGTWIRIEFTKTWPHTITQEKPHTLLTYDGAQLLMGRARRGSAEILEG
ncbi:tail protein [Edwardsiella phage eiAU]|uniref:Host specificity protein n=1 Tax=Edwardsiella phage eiAU TaxID=945083 RepID=W0LM01_9CAUD|nr:tail protein [Edwardsiella phage eiAU]AHG23422.1 host specificity protein [Edwardsiella phage eiAU]